MAVSERRACNLADFEEDNPNCIITSPRSLQACKTEGVLPKELEYKGIEYFAEKNLSPRLVKLRYDFFEAKRKDLLAAARKAREQLLAEEKREKDNIQLDVLAKQSGLSKGAILALNSDNLKQERQKLLKAQEKERNWLKNQLRSELHQLKTLETNDANMKKEASDNSAATREKARRMKELNDKRAAMEERKAMEAEARQKLEKEIAKQEFHKAQEELKRKAELNAQKEKEAYMRQLKNAEDKRLAEDEKARKREEAFDAQEAKKKDMRAQDLKRTELMEQQKQQFNLAMSEKKELRDLRIYKSMENNQDLERKRREDFENRMRHEQIRDERLAQQRAEDQEAAAKKSFQLMMRRKMIQDEAARKAEDHRNGILSEQEGKEARLLEHEQKKERYLDFKRELDGLRLKNKEINVERQRRKEEAERERIAEDVRKKDEKMEWMQSERKRLWQIRRATQTEAYRAREIVKNEIMRQRVKSAFKTDDLAKHVESHLTHDLFNPKILQTSSSMPALRSAVEAHQRSIESKSEEPIST
mmetsp:Transcript_96652/g.152929  ORF Transcript_96652/g.152929 Transcript_96652/m.152929 type:complete len:532 (-) Transcript_96652:142-1737(-)|eukprot:CAMPEP_0169085498 /NCGR_PEP_ID=MMETSP1015-20121227/13197_1 /TAXON_ID=342587 /ORGANISM="Karlodinium micrum, Strain CCMP2283" /LENGTH=531 /DNA_ID=CAMNT_0009145599 /DNA_START=86 /DNA_END=1681 /DNA_ORIENTATION=+